MLLADAVASADAAAGRFGAVAERVYSRQLNTLNCHIKDFDISAYYDPKPLFLKRIYFCFLAQMPASCGTRPLFRAAGGTWLWLAGRRAAPMTVRPPAR